MVIDGCPAGVALEEADIQVALERRAPGRTPWTSPRKETDQVELLSGVFQGKATGAPITLLIRNHDADSSKYAAFKGLLRPGHANATYLAKYGVCDERGGGRASARETACRVAAGAIAGKILSDYKIKPLAFLAEAGGLLGKFDLSDEDLKHLRDESPLFCPDSKASEAICQRIAEVKEQGDSVGGVVGFVVPVMPVGLGEPVYDRLEARLAQAMLSIPAAKGFEIGSGFEGSRMLGSEHNDLFSSIDGKVVTTTNHAGGVLGGISNGMPLTGSVAFKPTSSIQKPQSTVDTEGRPQTLQLPEGSRHDPCVAIRAVPVVEAMLNLVLVDFLLLGGYYHLEPSHKIMQPQSLRPFLPL